MKNLSKSIPAQTIGIDIGEKYSHFVVLDQEGNVTKSGRVFSRPLLMKACFSEMSKSRVIIENGSHSRWIFELLKKLGHEVIVANPRNVRLIYQGRNKTDRIDAEKLARLGRVDVKLLNPIWYRSQRTQADLVVLRARDSLVRSRARLVSSVRGLLKPFGEFLPKCSTNSFAEKVKGLIPAELQEAVGPLIETIAQISESIRECDRKIRELCAQKYPQTHLLRQVAGVGPVTSLAFVLTIEDQNRFRRTRQVGAYLGLVPKNAQSGDSAPQMRIGKGDEFLKRLLVGSGHYILGHYGPDCDLKRFGERLAQTGGKRAKKRAVVAVARKLSGLLCHLWQMGEEYDPFYQKRLHSDSVTV